MGKLNRLIREAVEDELVDEALQAQMVDALDRSLRWLPRTTRQHPYSLPSPYGVLDVWSYFAGCWTVNRNSNPLIKHDGRHAAVFTSVAAAKAAGLLHLRDGFGDRAPHNDGLRWKIDLHARQHIALQDVCDFAGNSSMSDDHEWGRDELQRLLKNSRNVGAAADENLVIDIRRVAQWWRLPLPQWAREAHGFHFLNTPYARLSVRRMIGWTVERSGLPLVWSLGGQRVILDKLEDAKTSALIHVADSGWNIRYVDGTRWREPTEAGTATEVGPTLSAA